jgi:zinc/manganese transport system substrate-binding protein
MYRVTFLLASLLGALTLVNSGSAAASQSTRLPVIATFSILGDIVQNVGGEHVQVRTLVGPDGDMHVYEPTPADARALVDAALLFEIGQGFEPRIADLYRASRSRAERVTVTEGLTLIPSAADDAHRHGPSDPHVWQDVANAVYITTVVRDALARADPANRDAYFLNAAVYSAYLLELDAWIVGQVATVPPSRRVLVTSHHSLTYFARRYGFEVLGAASGSVSTEGQPSARELAALVQRIRAAGVPAVFGENLGGNRLMERLAAEARVSLATLYTDALGRPGSDGDTYERMMRANVTTIVGALGQ